MAAAGGAGATVGAREPVNGTPAGRPGFRAVYPHPRAGPRGWFTAGVDLDRLGTGERVVAAAGLALAVDLAFLPWHRFDLGIVVVPRTAVQWPFALLGVPALAIAVAMVTAVVVGRATDVALPGALAGWPPRLEPAGLAVVGLLVAKVLARTRPLGYGAYLGVTLAVVLAWGGRRVSREAGRDSPGPAHPG